MLNIEVSHDVGGMLGLVESLEDQIKDPDLKDPSKSVVKEFKSAIRGGRFSPLSTATKEIRSRRGRSGTRPLTDTGKLLNSIKVVTIKKARFTVGSKLRKSRLLRRGGVTAASSAIPGKKIPRRNYMSVNTKLLNTVAQEVLDGLKWK